MASYPASVKSFTTKVDGAGNKIFAAHVNDIQAEVTAIEDGLLNGTANLNSSNSTVARLNVTGGSTLTTATITGLVTLSGGQVGFPATQAPSADVNTLDDYEEGTWTPVIGGSGGTSGQSYTTQVGHYVKVGKLVTAYFNVVLSAKGTITTDVQIQGLPFTIENTANHNPPLLIAYWQTTASSFVSLGGFGAGNTTTATVTGATAAATGQGTLAASDIANTTQFIGSITYKASA